LPERFEIEKNLQDWQGTGLARMVVVDGEREFERDRLDHRVLLLDRPRRLRPSKLCKLGNGLALDHWVELFFHNLKAHDSTGINLKIP